MLSHLPLVAIMLLATTHAGWTEPKKILSRDENAVIYIQGVYRDPTSSVNHVYYSTGDIHHHKALLDDGTELYNTDFNNGYHEAAVLRGAGDGKRLFLAYRQRNPDVVKFAESSNGGKSWSIPVSIVEESAEYRTFGDMLYVEGRLFVFFIRMPEYSRPQEASIKMVSRAPNSLVFSPEKLIANNAAWSVEGLVASYERQGKRNYLHVAYNTGSLETSTIWYTQSVNNGVSWSRPREIKETMGYYIKSMRNIGERLYLVYSLNSHSSVAMMVRSANHGATFSAPMLFNLSSGTELATCASKRYKRLATFRQIEEKQISYALWNHATIKKEYEENYFTGEDVVFSAGIDCVVDETRGEREIPAFFTEIRDHKFSEIFFTVNTEGIAAEE